MHLSRGVDERNRLARQRGRDPLDVCSVEVLFDIFFVPDVPFFLPLFFNIYS